MSEYIEIEAEPGDDGEIIFHTNLTLSTVGQEEFYATTTHMEEGSPVAQALAVIEGLETLTMRGGELVVTVEPGLDWHVVVADVTAALKEFFL